MGAGSIYFSARQITKQLKVVTFLEFTRRYAEIVERLPHRIRTDPLKTELKQLSEDDRQATELAIRSYSNLCSDEHYMHRERLVSKRIWRLWRRGLLRTLEIPAVRQVWKQARAEYDSEFRREIDGYVAAASDAAASEIHTAP